MSYYERFPDGRSAESHAFEADPEFLRGLTPWLGQLAGATRPRLGALHRLISGGFYVAKGGGHGRGQAMDIDEVAAHRDHLHCEDLGPVPLDHAARSHVVFCQAVCNALFGAALTIDGVWGRGTQASMDDAQRRVGVTGDLTGDLAVWVRWLTTVAATALRGETFVFLAGGRQ